MNNTEFPWASWNTLSSEERSMYLDHARSLVEKGYVQLDPGQDEIDLAHRCYRTKLLERSGESKTVQTIDTVIGR